MLPIAMCLLTVLILNSSLENSVWILKSVKIHYIRKNGIKTLYCLYRYDPLFKGILILCYLHTYVMLYYYIS